MASSLRILVSLLPLLIPLLLRRKGEPERPMDIRPSGTRRAVRTLHSAGVRAAESNPATHAGRSDLRGAGPALVRVTLVGPDRDIGAGHALFYLIEPGAFLPEIDEVRWPATRAANLLQDALGARPSERAAAERRLLVAALEDRWTVHDQSVEAAHEDPWAAVLLLEVERLRAEEDYEQERAAREAEFRDQFGVDPDRVYPPAWPAGHRRAAREAWAALRALRTDVVPRIELAEQLLTEIPTHPVADFARIYLLDAVSVRAREDRDFQDAAELAIDVLAETDDPLVAQQAAELLASTENVVLTPGDFDALADAADEFPEDAGALAALGLRSAVRTGTDGAGRWWERLGASCDCQSVPAGLLCQRLCEVWVRGGQVLVADGRIVADTWQQALRADVQRCWDGGASLSEGLAAGSWRGSWSWEVDNIGVVACLPATGRPEPPLGQRVLLQVDGAL